MLRTQSKLIVDKQGKPLQLKGIALGGWLMMEGYMLGGDNIPESQFKQNLLKERASEFTWQFRNCFINKKDAQRIKELGFNCVRLPFNYRILKEADGFKHLKAFAKMFMDEGLYVILDMHAVPGAQNQDWHSDSSGKAMFFEDQKFRDEYVGLWDKLSREFKDQELIAGYDIMNEPVTDNPDLLKETYKSVIKTIRNNSNNHIIFLEGNLWAREIDFLKDLIEENVAYSIHFYGPTKFTFNEDPKLKYPGSIDGILWNKEAVKKKLSRYSKLNAPVYVGEFGVSSNRNKGELEYLNDVLEIFSEFGFHWTYWTYKSIAPMPFPDGLFQQKRPQNEAGMKNIKWQLDEDEKKFYKSFETDRFVLNASILNLLKKQLVN